MSDEENVYEYQVPHTSEESQELLPGLYSTASKKSLAELLKKAHNATPTILPMPEQVEFLDNTNGALGYLQADVNDMEPAYPDYPDANYAPIGVSHDDLSDQLANVQNNMDALHKDVQATMHMVAMIYDHLGLGDASST